MKRLLILLLIMVLSISFALNGCGVKPETNSGDEMKNEDVIEDPPEDHGQTDDPQENGSIEETDERIEESAIRKEPNEFFENYIEYYISTEDRCYPLQYENMQETEYHMLFVAECEFNSYSDNASELAEKDSDIVFLDENGKERARVYCDTNVLRLDGQYYICESDNVIIYPHLYSAICSIDLAYLRSNVDKVVEDNSLDYLEAGKILAERFYAVYLECLNVNMKWSNFAVMVKAVSEEEKKGDWYSFIEDNCYPFRIEVVYVADENNPNKLGLGGNTVPYEGDDPRFAGGVVDNMCCRIYLEEDGWHWGSMGTGW